MKVSSSKHQKISQKGLVFNIKNVRILSEISEQEPFIQQPISDAPSIKYSELYSNLIDMYNKRKYRKLFSDLTKNERKYNRFNLSNNLSITHLHIECALAIIKKKFYKYMSKSIIKNVDNWLGFVDGLIDKLSNQIPLLEYSAQVEQYEILSFYNLIFLYYYALLSKHNKKITDCISYLTLAERVIDNISNGITKPRTCSIIIKIYLFISSMMISDNDYSTAQQYLDKTIKLCYKEIELRMKSYNIYNKDKDNIKFINNRYSLFCLEEDECFIHMGITYYQLGVCFENKKEFDKANDCYIHSRAFFEYTSDDYITLKAFITNVSYNCKRKYKCEQLIELKEVNNPDYKEKVIKKKEAKLYYDENEYFKKYDGVTQLIESLKLNEIDDDDQDLFDEVGKKPRSFLVKKMTKNVLLYNYLLSDEFKPVIADMKSMDVNKLDHDIKRTIQKKIITIKADQRARHSYTLSNKSISSSNMSINGMTLSQKTSKGHTRFNTFSCINGFTSKSSNSRSIKTAKSVVRYPLKINYDKFAFRKSYRAKYSYIDKLTNKEYTFQKNLLKNKKYETVVNEDYDEEKLKRNAELLYKIELGDSLKILEQKDNTVKNTNDNKSSTIRSITSNKMNEKYMGILHKAISKFNDPKTKCNSSNYNDEYMRESNKRMLNKLNADLENINKREKRIYKVILNSTK